MPSERSKTDANMNLVPFSWDEYLKDSEDIPAPKICFKQAVDPPVNEFQPGMKLESRDPRNSMSYCIATVIATCGPRLCLRLDGSDNRNDFWSLVDSEDIHPSGWCNGVGEQLVPPLGFAKNAVTYPAFLAKLLAESADKMAPRSAFKDVPPTPKRNMFSIGMKLEAIDKKNPHLICPATVGDIDGDKIYIQFDGWRGAFDYWCRYDSRDIFPVGWCSSTGHPLHPPGTKGNAVRGRPTVSKQLSSISPSVSVHIETTPGLSTGVPSPGSARSAGSKKLVSPSPSLSPAASTDNASNTVTAYINQTCSCGPMLNQTAIIRLPLHYGPYPVHRTLRKVVQALVDSGNSTMAIFNMLTTGPSTLTITAKVNGKSYSCSIPYVTTESGLQSYISNLLEKLEACPNLITLHPPHRICLKCGSGQAPIQHTELSKRHSSSVYESGPSKKTLTERVRGVRNQSTAVSHSASSTAQHNGSNNLTSPLQVSTHYGNQTNGFRSPAGINPVEWTSNDVIEYIRSKDQSLVKYSHLIQSHEIDGRAFLLMTSDIAIKYMSMKVGPALKLCSLVDQLKLSMRH